MTKTEFGEFVNNKFESCKDILQTKGHDYTQGSDDRLKNFKDIAEELEVDPMFVWYVYFKKHIDAIKTHIKLGGIMSESIESRFTDAINYLLLGEALIRDLMED